MLRLCLFLFLTSFSSVYNVKLSSKFQICKRQQPDLKECTLKAAQNGIDHLSDLVEELHLRNFDPVYVESATIGAGKSAVAVTQKFKNCNVTGLRLIKFDHFEFDFDKKVLKVSAVVPDVNKHCFYDLDGQILMLPIKGTGPSTVVLKNVKLNFQMKFEEVKKNNKIFLKFTSSELDADPEVISFNFENLFNGDKKLGDNLNKVLNENWKAVFDDVKDGYLEIVKQIFLNLFNQFSSKVSMEEMFG